MESLIVRRLAVGSIAWLGLSTATIKPLRPTRTHTPEIHARISQDLYLREFFVCSARKAVTVIFPDSTAATSCLNLAKRLASK